MIQVVGKGIMDLTGIKEIDWDRIEATLDDAKKEEKIVNIYNIEYDEPCIYFEMSGNKEIDYTPLEELLEKLPKEIIEDSDFICTVTEYAEGECFNYDVEKKKMV